MQPVIECCKLPLILGKTLQEESRRLLWSQQPLNSQEESDMFGLPAISDDCLHSSEKTAA